MKVKGMEALEAQIQIGWIRWWGLAKLGPRSLQGLE